MYTCVCNIKITTANNPCIIEVFSGINFHQCSQYHYRFCMYTLDNTGQKIIHKRKGKKVENILQVKFSSFIVQKLKWIKCLKYWYIVAEVTLTGIGFQLIVDEASITQSTEEVVKTTECNHQDRARNDICVDACTRVCVRVCVCKVGEFTIHLYIQYKHPCIVHQRNKIHVYTYAIPNWELNSDY